MGLGPKIPQAVEQRIVLVKMSHREWTAKQVQAVVDGELGGRGWPGLSAVQKIITKRFPKNQPPIPWRMADSEGQDTGRILALLRSIVTVDNPEPVLTAEEVKRVLWVADAAPGLEPHRVLLLGRIYATYEGQGWPTRPLDLYLLHAPWSNESAYDTYTVLVELGKIPPVPFWPELVVGQNPKEGPFVRYLAKEAWEKGEEAIMGLLDAGEILAEGEIAERLGLKAELVSAICGQLKREGRIQDIPNSGAETGAAASEDQRLAELEAREKREQGLGTGEAPLA